MFLDQIEGQVADEDDLIKILSAMKPLIGPRVDMSVLRLRKSYSAREIVRMTGMAPGKVRAAISRARKGMAEA